jgi:hypothetical protein
MTLTHISPWQWRLGGALLTFLGTAGTTMVWYYALNDWVFYFKASGIFPTFLILGIGMVVFPNPKQERLERGEDVLGMTQRQLITPRWWTIFAAALLSGLISYAMMNVLESRARAEVRRNDAPPAPAKPEPIIRWKRPA